MIFSDLSELAFVQIFPQAVSNISDFRYSQCYRIGNLAIINVGITVTDVSQSASFDMNFDGDYVFKNVQAWMADAYSSWDYANQMFIDVTTDTGVNVTIHPSGKPYVQLNCVAFIWKS